MSSACSKANGIMPQKTLQQRSVNDDTKGALFYLTNIASLFLPASYLNMVAPNINRNLVMD